MVEPWKSKATHCGVPLITRRMSKRGAATAAAQKFVETHRQSEGGLAELGLAEKVIYNRIKQKNLDPHITEMLVRLVHCHQTKTGGSMLEKKDLLNAFKDHGVISKDILLRTAECTLNKYVSPAVGANILERMTGTKGMAAFSSFSVTKDCLARQPG